MRNFLPTVAIEFRRSLLLWLFPFLLALGIYLTFTSIDAGIGYWPNGAMATSTSIILLGPLFAGLAAWIGGREMRRDLVYLRTLASRHGWLFPLAELSATVAWVTLTFAGILVAVTIRIETTNPAGSVPTLMLISNWLTLLVYVGLGYLIGRAVWRVYVPPLVAAAVFGAEALDNQSASWTLLDPTLDRLVDVFNGPRSGLYPAHLLWLAGLLGCFVLGAMALTKLDWRAITGAVVPVAIATVGAVQLIGYDGRFFAPSEPEFNYACTDTTITICVHPAFRIALPDLHERFDPIAERVADTPAEFHRLEQRPRGVGGEPSPGSLAIHMDNWSPPAILDHAEGEFLDQFLDLEDCFLGPQPTSEQDIEKEFVSDDLGHLVGGWLTGREQSATLTDISAEHDFLFGLDEDEGKAWLTEHYEAFTHCRLAPDDFR